MHRAKAREFGYGWMAVCKDCNWRGGDHPGHDEEAMNSAEIDAKMHQRGERHPWEAEKIVPWTREQRPFADF